MQVVTIGCVVRQVVMPIATSCDKHHIETWDVTYWRRKWRWTSRLAEQQHNRWSRLAFTWQPAVHHRFPVYRRHGRPHKRWNDDIYNFIQTTPHQSTDDPLSSNTITLQIATDSATWQQLESKFIEFMKETSNKQK